jgi:hypothetical protein
VPLWHITTYDYLPVDKDNLWVNQLEKLLGSTKVQPNNRITLIKQIQKRLNIKIGDMVIYVEDEKGNIIIKKGQIKPV